MVAARSKNLAFLELAFEDLKKISKAKALEALNIGVGFLPTLLNVTNRVP